ncbi:NAD/NADP-dependent betaine aldehyde dehydrogenase [Streptomyces californicus]
MGPADRATVVGPVISAAHRDRVEAYVELGRKEGARVVAGGERPGHLDRGFYVAPTLLADCTADMRVVRDEIFGPVVVVVPFDDEEEAIALADDSDYGLIDYVWSGDVARAFRIARRLRAGGVGVNTVGRNMEAPSAGSRRAGWGGTWARTRCTPTARRRRSSGRGEGGEAVRAGGRGRGRGTVRAGAGDGGLGAAGGRSGDGRDGGSRLAARTGAGKF